VSLIVPAGAGATAPTTKMTLASVRILVASIVISILARHLSGLPQVTSDQWYPSGDQPSPLVYQGSVGGPDPCGGGALDLARGGTFSATLG